MSISALFVGGPWDGRREIVKSTVIDAIIFPESRAMDVDPTKAKPIPEPRLPRVTYHEFVRSAEHSIFIPTTMVGDDVINRVFEGYRAAGDPITRVIP